METVSSLFRRDTIFLLDEEKEYSKEEVLQILGEKLLEKGYVKESFTEAVLEREEKYPTGLRTEPYPVAIPHTDPGHVNVPCISIVRLKCGVQFHEMVDLASVVRVNVIFCIALPEADQQTDVLQHLMGIAGDGELMKELIDAESTEDIYRMVSDHV